MRLLIVGPLGGQISAATKIAMEHGGKLHRNFDRLVVGDGAELELGHDYPLYASSTKSRVTTILTGNPGRMVSVGATLS